MNQKPNVRAKTIKLLEKQGNIFIILDLAMDS